MLKRRLTTELFLTALFYHKSCTDLLRVWWFYCLQTHITHHLKIRAGMPCGGDFLPQNGTYSLSYSYLQHIIGGISKQRLHVLILQHLFTRTVESQHVVRKSRFTREQTDLEMFTSAGKWVEETPTLRNSTSTGSH